MAGFRRDSQVRCTIFRSLVLEKSWFSGEPQQPTEPTSKDFLLTSSDSDNYILPKWHPYYFKMVPSEIYLSQAVLVQFSEELDLDWASDQRGHGRLKVLPVGVSCRWELGLNLLRFWPDSSLVFICFQFGSTGSNCSVILHKDLIFKWFLAQYLWSPENWVHTYFLQLPAGFLKLPIGTGL